MQTDLIRIGTRGSALALAQAHETRRRLMQAWELPEDAFEIVVIRTTGDRIQDRALSEAGGKGLFTKELEESLYDGSIDFAVHSSKDMPTALPEGLEISAYLPREDVRDVLISAAGQRLVDLPAGAVIGTSSLRRQSLLLKLRPDLKVVLFRGNVQTRLAKLAAGEVDATLLALAGLNRLGMSHVATETLSAEAFPPAVGQGAICIESRIGDERVARLLAPISDADTGTALTCERAFLHALDGSCRTPLAGYARVLGDAIEFYGLILTPDGTRYHEISVTGQRDQAEVLGRDAGLRIRATAGEGFFQGWN